MSNSTRIRIRHMFNLWQSAILSIAITVAVTVIVCSIIRHFVSPFGPLSAFYVAKYTLYGAVAGAIGYAILWAITRKANLIFLILSLIVLVVSFIPDLRFFHPMMMHVMNGARGMPSSMPMHGGTGMSGMPHTTRTMPVGQMHTFKKPSSASIIGLMCLHVVATTSIVLSLTGLTKPKKQV